MSELCNVDLSGALWRKSSRSSATKECVEVAFIGREAVGVRDSKDASGPALIFAPDQWQSFVRGVAAGRFGNNY